MVLLNTDVLIIKIPGMQGPAGSGGTGGGTTTLSGSGVPANGLGANGNWYRDTVSGDWYEKVSNVWTKRGPTLALSGHTHTSAQVTDLTEAVQDAVASLITSGSHTGITWNYNDASNTLSATVTASGGTTDPEVVRDSIATALRGVGLTVTADDAGDTITLTADVTSVAGKTGSVSLVKGDVGLGNVDNTSDSAKPISAATSTALALKADLVDGKVPAAQLPASSGSTTVDVNSILMSVGERSFDDFGSDDNARVTALNAYLRDHNGGPSRAVRLPARQINTTVPVSLYSGATILGREGPSREFQRGTIWNWQGGSGSNALAFPADGQTSQSYPSDGSPRDITMNNIQWQGGSSTNWMPRNNMSGSDIAGKTLWYCEFKDSGWKNFSTVWHGYTTGCSFATGVSHFQAIGDTAIFLGGSETTVFGHDGYSFAASSTSTQTATPFMRSMLSKSTIGKCMITARTVGWGLTIEGGYNSTFDMLALDAQDSSRFNGKMMLISGGTGHVISNMSFKGGMNAPTASDKGFLMITGGSQLLIQGNKFTRYQTNYAADQPVIHVGSSVGTRAVALGLNTYDRFNDPAVVGVANTNQVINNDSRAILQVVA